MGESEMPLDKTPLAIPVLNHTSSGLVGLDDGAETVLVGDVLNSSSGALITSKRV